MPWFRRARHVACVAPQPAPQANGSLCTWAQGVQAQHSHLLVILHASNPCMVSSLWETGNSPSLPLLQAPLVLRIHPKPDFKVGALLKAQNGAVEASEGEIVVYGSRDGVVTFPSPRPHPQRKTHSIPFWEPQVPSPHLLTLKTRQGSRRRERAQERGKEEKKRGRGKRGRGAWRFSEQSPFSTVLLFKKMKGMMEKGRESDKFNDVCSKLRLEK